MNEKDLQDKLRNHEKAPPEGVWEGVQGRLKQKRRLSFSWLFLSIPLILTLLVGGYVLIEPLGPANDVNNYQGSFKGSEDINNTIHSQEKEKNRNGNNPTKEAKKGLADLSNKPSKNRAGNTNKKVGKAHETANSNKANREIDSRNVNTNEAAGFKVSSDNAENEDRLAYGKGREARNKLLKFQKLNAGFNQNTFPQEVSTIHFSTDNILPDSLSESLKDENRDKEQKQWQVGIELAPFINQYRYQLRSDSEIGRRGKEATMSAESAGKGFMINATAKYHLSERIGLITGLGYSYVKQDFSHKLQDDYQMLEGSDNQNSNASQEGLGTGPDNSSRNQDSTDNINDNLTQRAQNTYHLVNVPLMVNYHIIEQSNFSLFARAGFRFQYLFSIEDNLIRKQNVNEFAMKVKGTDNELINPFNAGYTIQTGLRYHLDKDWSIHLSPDLEGQFFSLYDESYFLERKSLRYGVNLGISKSF